MTSQPPHHAGRTGRVNLNQIAFSAKLDYVTIATPGRCALPALAGTVCWPRSANGSLVTIQDPTASDVVVLAEAVGNLRLHEIEVAVDLRPRPSRRGPEGTQIVQDIMVDLIASCLEPSEAAGALKQFRGYVRKGEHGPCTVGPFNRRLPLPTDQQLHGGRQDDVQVKAYFKRTDARRPLPEHLWVARLEVRLSGAGLASKGLDVVASLVDFQYRRKLTPLLRHVKGVRVGKKACKDKYVRSIRSYREREHQRQFDARGCGPFVKGSNPEQVPDVLLVRDKAVNARLGTALAHLERRLDREKNRALSAGTKCGRASPDAA